MKTTAEFEALFDSELRPMLEPLEQDRKKFVATARNILFIWLGLSAAGYGAHVLFRDQIKSRMEASDAPEYLYLGIFLGLVFLIMLIIYIVRYYRFKKAYTSRFKAEVISRMVKFLDDSLSFSEHGGISELEFRRSYLFLKDPDRYKTEDYVSGTVGKTAIYFSEVHAEYKTVTTDGKGHRKETWHDIFKGILFAADFNKNFGTRTVVLPDSLSFLGNLGQSLQNMNFQRDQLIKLEDPEFEKYFVVYGQDQVEARYILTPALMERITNFRKKSGKKISISWVNSNMYLALPVKENLFEPNIFVTIMKKEFLLRYHSYLDLVVGIVEDMNLNTRIWTKE